jgi:hypothetical protein
VYLFSRRALAQLVYHTGDVFGRIIHRELCSKMEDARILIGRASTRVDAASRRGCKRKRLFHVTCESGDSVIMTLFPLFHKSMCHHEPRRVAFYELITNERHSNRLNGIQRMSAAYRSILQGSSICLFFLSFTSTP